MKSKISNLTLVIAMLLSITVLAVSPVSAHGGDDDTSGSSTSGSGSHNSDDDSPSSDDDNSTTHEDETEVEHGVETETHHNKAEFTHKVNLWKLAGASELAKLRQQHGKHSHKERMNICEQREKSINGKVHGFGNHAENYLTRLNTIFTKIQAYQEKKQLDVSNYNELLQAATAKESAATTAVEALKEVAVNIDCTADDPAANLATVKQAAHDARDALKAYRSALKDLVKALIQASKASTEAEGSDT